MLAVDDNLIIPFLRFQALLEFSASFKGRIRVIRRIKDREGLNGELSIRNS
ncbi:hypothetical protein SBDP1_920025 [Syntrophobacter sp. SbD1]|nr:hypothetical protein SBDP1_920025 [Syntrophobacter sp. SbD1]